MLISTTAPKLYEMSQIKGWVPGGVPLQVTVTSKWHETADESQDGREAYWVAWNGGDITVSGKHRSNMFQEQWESIKIGDIQDIVYIQWSDDTYLKDGIFVSFGNFIFDFILLTLELLGIYYFVRVAKQTFTRWKFRTNA
jgi:hypothetical protein